MKILINRTKTMLTEVRKLSGILASDEKSEYDPRDLFDIIDKINDMYNIFEELLKICQRYMECLNTLFDDKGDNFPESSFEELLKDLSYTIQKFKEMNGRSNGVKNLEDMVKFGHQLIVAIDSGMSEFSLKPSKLDNSDGEKEKTEIQAVNNDNLIPDDLNVDVLESQPVAIITENK